MTQQNEKKPRYRDLLLVILIVNAIVLVLEFWLGYALFLIAQTGWNWNSFWGVYLLASFVSTVGLGISGIVAREESAL